MRVRNGRSGPSEAAPPVSCLRGRNDDPAGHLRRTAASGPLNPPSPAAAPAHRPPDPPIPRSPAGRSGTRRMALRGVRTGTGWGWLGRRERTGTGAGRGPRPAARTPAPGSPCGRPPRGIGRAHGQTGRSRRRPTGHGHGHGAADRRLPAAAPLGRSAAGRRLQGLRRPGPLSRRAPHVLHLPVDLPCAAAVRLRARLLPGGQPGSPAAAAELGARGVPGARGAAQRADPRLPQQRHRSRHRHPRQSVREPGVLLRPRSTASTRSGRCRATSGTTPSGRG